MQDIALNSPSLKETNQLQAWRTITLGEAFKFTKKPTELQYSDYQQIPFVPMELIPTGKTLFNQYILKSREEIPSGTYFEPGDILLAKITPSFENGKQGIIENLPTPFGIASTEVIPIKEIAGISSKHFLFYFLLKHDIRHILASKMEGSTGRQRLHVVALANFEINLPPLPEQRAIAHILQTVQNTIQARRREIELERERKAAVMQHLFTHGTKNEPTKMSEIGEIPESWKVVKLGDIANINSGGTPDRAKHEYWNGDIPWVKTGEINYNLILKVEEKITREGLKNSSAKVIPSGTLLMAMYGQGITRGRVAILGIDAAINQACAAITVHNSMLTEFLFYFLAYNYEIIRELGHGANQKNLNSVLIKSITIPIPGSSEQKEIAKILQSCDSKIAALEKELALHEELFRALLDELMSGRLAVGTLVGNQDETGEN